MTNKIVGPTAVKELTEEMRLQYHLKLDFVIEGLPLAYTIRLLMRLDESSSVVRPLRLATKETNDANDA